MSIKSPDALPLELAGKAVPVDIALDRLPAELAAFFEQLGPEARKQAIAGIASQLFVEATTLVDQTSGTPDAHLGKEAVRVFDQKANWASSHVESIR